MNLIFIIIGLLITGAFIGSIHDAVTNPSNDEDVLFDNDTNDNQLSLFEDE